MRVGAKTLGILGAADELAPIPMSLFTLDQARPQLTTLSIVSSVNPQYIHHHCGYPVHAENGAQTTITNAPSAPEKAKVGRDGTRTRRTCSHNTDWYSSKETDEDLTIAETSINRQLTA